MGTGATSDASAFAPCDWPMWGYALDRPFTTACESEITAATASALEQAWRFRSRDVVTATPAVVDGTAYVGDWSGRFYALDVATGEARWTFDAPVHPTVYAGQIVSSAAVADDPVSGRRLVVFGAGRTLHALDTATGEVVWTHDVNPGGDETDPSEIQSSPVVADGIVVFGFDGHDVPGVRSGLRGLDLATGELLWDWDPDEGGEPTGCAGVWSSPAVDLERRAVYVGTANCYTAPDGYGEFSEAIVAVGLDDGRPRWSFQPHEPNDDDLDFPGAPNLFAVDGVDAVGLGNKDGTYYAVERDTGAELWRITPVDVRIAGADFSTGGFIGPSARAGDVVVAVSAVGGECPCIHAFDTAGELLWQQDAAGPTFGAAMAAGDIAVVGGTTDFTLRVLRLSDGEVLWDTPMPGAVAGGAVLTADTLLAVSGIREPGLDAESEAAGVVAFRLGDGDQSDTTAGPGTAGSLPPTTAAPPPEATPPTVAGDPRPCVAEPCSLGFELKAPPAGTAPVVTVHVRPAPFRLEVRTEGLGPPEGWLRPGGVAAERGAVAYGVFVSVSDDRPAGTLLCILDLAGDCVTDVLPDPLDPTYNRLSILAIVDGELPEPVEGFDRLVTTRTFDPPLELG